MSALWFFILRIQQVGLGRISEPSLVLVTHRAQQQNLAWMTADQQGGSQLAFAIANNTTQTQTYEVSFFENNALPLRGRVTLPAQTSVSKFLTEILPASANSVGPMRIELNAFTFPDPGFSAMALRYTGAAFTTVPVACVPIC